MTIVASRLKMHPSKLRRYLTNEGLTFEAVRDEVHFTVARELLELATLSMGEISSALTLSAQDTFSRSAGAVTVQS